MDTKLFTSMKFLILTVLIMLPLSAKADFYYYTDNDPYIDCYASYSCHPRHYVHVSRHHKYHKVAYHKGYYFSRVVVYYPVSAPCGMGGCGGGYWAWVPAYEPREYVTFSSKMVHYRGPEYVGFDNESYDMRTADDDVCADPDMNNQY